MCQIWDATITMGELDSSSRKSQRTTDYQDLQEKLAERSSYGIWHPGCHHGL